MAARSRLSPEREALLLRAEEMYVWGHVIDGKQEWPSIRQLVDLLPGSSYKFLVDQSQKHRWAERRSAHRARLAQDAHEKSRHQWSEMNRQVVQVHHQTVTRLTRLLNEDIALKERMVQRAKNEELVQRGLGNDDAVVAFGFKSGDLLDLARATDICEKNHARVMARAQALPLMIDPEDVVAEVEPDDDDVAPVLSRMEDIIAAVAKNEIAAGLRNGTLAVSEDGAVVAASVRHPQ